MVTYHREYASRTYKRSETKNGTQGVLSAVPAHRSLVDLLDAALNERCSTKATVVELLRLCSNFELTVDLPLLSESLEGHRRSAAELVEVEPGDQCRSRQSFGRRSLTYM